MHAPGPDPDRILVIGSGAVVGYGVLSYGLSVSGQLAKEVAAATGRGVDLRIIADPDLTVRAARTALDATKLERYDVIVITVGSLDALELLPRREWGVQMGLLLDSTGVETRSGQEVLVIGIPQLTSLVKVPRFYSSAVARCCDELNKESSLQAAGRSGVTFVQFSPPAIDLLENASREVHTVWARILAPSVVAVLGG